MGLQFLADQCVPIAVVEDLRDETFLGRSTSNSDSSINKI